MEAARVEGRGGVGGANAGLIRLIYSDSTVESESLPSESKDSHPSSSGWQFPQYPSRSGWTSQQDTHMVSLRIRGIREDILAE